MSFWLTIGAINGALAVAFGAFGAHGLKGKVPDADFAAFETAANYHLTHALALLAIAFAADRIGGSLITTSGWAITAGILLFSGSLYFLGITGSRALVLLTPLGGTAFIFGWVCLAIAAFRFSAT